MENDEKLTLAQAHEKFAKSLMEKPGICWQDGAHP